MSAPQQSSVRNQLLAALPREDFVAFQPHLERVEFELRRVLIEPNELIESVYFPEVGYPSVGTNANDGKFQIGIIGREGMVGVIVALGVRQPEIPASFNLSEGCSPAKGALSQLWVGSFQISRHQSAAQLCLNA
ncbi:Crp/Fnr family transcriptional regulator [Microvirga mediterraneensis]|uniref:Crp/Fnr family transcriptional regulator n=1 Tax=Microvirga mediterraneensis TaxID=2754695 RepID=A0A838BV55_9HYPH|nr:Crp/Fnr family transcriptional regulator [Microvirga mediterraneensis]MBA1159311.1 Crp/Fnr family transcriptional regulator [Microvirga mediterraneensis]